MRQYLNIVFCGNKNVSLLYGELTVHYYLFVSEYHQSQRYSALL